MTARGGGTAQPIAGLRLALVGPGKVGSSLARWLVTRGAELLVVARNSPKRLPRWAAAAGARMVALEALTTADCDVLLLAVPDGAVQSVAAALAARPQAPVALHTSGLLTVDALSALRQTGSAIGGLHPLRAFPRAQPSAALASRTFFALQGEERA